MNVSVSTLNGHNSAIHCLRWNNYNSDSFLSTSLDRSVCTWTPGREIPVRAFSGHTDSVTCADWVPEEPHAFISGSCDRTVRTWDTRERVACTSTFSLPGERPYQLCCSPDGQHVIITSFSDQLNVLDRKSMKIVRRVQFGFRVFQIAFLAPSSQLLVCTEMGSVHVLSWPSLKRTAEVQGHVGGVYCVRPNQKGNVFVTSGADGCVNQWDADEMLCVSSFQRSVDAVRGVVPIGDGSMLVCSGTRIKKGAAQRECFVAIVENRTKVVKGSVDVSGMVTSLEAHPEKNVVAFVSEQKNSKVQVAVF